MTRLIRTFAEVVSVLRRFGRMEAVRRQLGPAGAMAQARRLGEACRTRDAAGRASLRRAIRFVDRAKLGSTPNCFRRALVEISLDSGAATEPLMMGFRHGGGPRSGHAWLASEAESAARYDAVISI